MSGICRNCRNHPRGPLKCGSWSKYGHIRCRRCRENDLVCISDDVVVIEHPTPPKSTHRSSSAAFRSNTARFLHPRPYPLRAASGRFLAASIETGDEISFCRKEIYTRPSQDSLAGNVRKILIALDIGSGNIKAAWKPIYSRRGQRALVDRIRHGCRPVIWNNGQAHCPAQIAYKLTNSKDGRPYLRKIWGCDVDVELERGDIAETDVLKWVKPVIFNYDDTDSVQFHKGHFEQRLRGLKRKAGKAKVPENQWNHIDENSVYSDLMAFAYDFVCGKVLDEFPRLGPILSLGSEASSSGLDIEVALPVPASSLPKHIKIVLEAAKRAHLPHPFPVAEPTAAIVYYLQEQMETSTDQSSVEDQTVLLLDAGEGSLDAILCSVAAQPEQETTINILSEAFSKKQFVLEEEVAGLTEWAGGSFANQACQYWLESSFEAEFDEMLIDPVYSKRYSSRGSIVNELLREFEKRKKRFSGSSLAYGDEVRLILDGFPPRRTNSNRGGYITIDKVTMMDLFAKQLDMSMALIKAQMQRFEEKLQRKSGFRSIDQIILVGGANESKYIREAIRRAQISHRDSSGGVEVRLPQAERLNTMTAQGSLLLLQDKDFIGERILRRGYCVKWDEPTQLQTSTSDFVVEEDLEDGIMCKKDVSRFLLRIGDRIGYRHRVSMRQGWRALHMHPAIDDTGFDHTTGCYLIDEHFFFCDKASRDGLYVYHALNGFHEVGVVRFQLSQTQCQNFIETYKYEGEEFWRMEYEVCIEIVGLDFRYKMIIPETGVFKGDGLDDYGQRPIIEEGSLTWESNGGLCIL